MTKFYEKYNEFSNTVKEEFLELYNLYIESEKYKEFYIFLESYPEYLELLIEKKGLNEVIKIIKKLNREKDFDFILNLMLFYIEKQNVKEKDFLNIFLFFSFKNSFSKKIKKIVTIHFFLYLEKSTFNINNYNIRSNLQKTRWSWDGTEKGNNCVFFDDYIILFNHNWGELMIRKKATLEIISRFSFRKNDLLDDNSIFGIYKFFDKEHIIIVVKKEEIIETFLFSLREEKIIKRLDISEGNSSYDSPIFIDDLGEIILTFKDKLIILNPEKQLKREVITINEIRDIDIANNLIYILNDEFIYIYDKTRNSVVNRLSVSFFEDHPSGFYSGTTRKLLNYKNLLLISTSKNFLIYDLEKNKIQKKIQSDIGDPVGVWKKYAMAIILFKIPFFQRIGVIRFLDLEKDILYGLPVDFQGKYSNVNLTEDNSKLYCFRYDGLIEIFDLDKNFKERLIKIKESDIFFDFDNVIDIRYKIVEEKYLVIKQHSVNLYDKDFVLENSMQLNGSLINHFLLDANNTLILFLNNVINEKKVLRAINIINFDIVWEYPEGYSQEKGYLFDIVKFNDFLFYQISIDNEYIVFNLFWFLGFGTDVFKVSKEDLDWRYGKYPPHKIEGLKDIRVVYFEPTYSVFIPNLQGFCIVNLINKTTEIIKLTEQIKPQKEYNPDLPFIQFCPVNNLVFLKIYDVSQTYISIYDFENRKEIGKVNCSSSSKFYLSENRDKIIVTDNREISITSFYIPDEFIVIEIFRNQYLDSYLMSFALNEEENKLAFSTEQKLIIAFLDKKKENIVRDIPFQITYLKWESENEILAGDNSGNIHLIHIKENFNVTIHKEYKLVLLNDDINTFDYVENLLKDILKYSDFSAYLTAMMVHKKGKVVLLKGIIEDLETIYKKLSESGLKVEIVLDKTEFMTNRTYIKTHFRKYLKLKKIIRSFYFQLLILLTSH